MYKKLGVDALYLPFRVPRGQLPQALEAYDRIPVRGYSVTIPHKEAAAALARESEPNVQFTGSANTLVRRDDGKFTAANTDFAAIIDSLVWAPSERLARKRTLRGESSSRTTRPLRSSRFSAVISVVYAGTGSPNNSCSWRALTAP